MSDKKNVLVTGASKGIGKSLSQLMIDKGYNVIGTCREPEKLKSENKVPGVIYKKLDISDDKSISKLAMSLPTLDILVNNAGSSQMGPVEEVSIDNIQELFRINLFGHISIIQSVLPGMRNKKSGLIINITSFAAHTPVPFSAVYASAKSAMETLSKALNNEVNQFGIKVIAVAPVFVNTKIYQQKVCAPSSEYYPYFKKVSDKRDGNINNGTSPDFIAEKIMKIADIKKPGLFYAVGKNAFVLNLFSKILPNTLVFKNIRKKFGI